MHSFNSCTIAIATFNIKREKAINSSFMIGEMFDTILIMEVLALVATKE